MTPDRIRLYKLCEVHCEVLPVHVLPQVEARKTLSALTTALLQAALVLERKVKVTLIGTPSFPLAGPVVEFFVRQPI